MNSRPNLPDVLPPGSTARIYSEREGKQITIDVSGWYRAATKAGERILFEQGPPPLPYIDERDVILPNHEHEFTTRYSLIPSGRACRCGTVEPGSSKRITANELSELRSTLECWEHGHLQAPAPFTNSRLKLLIEAAERELTREAP